jgi:predicted GH43/DUF377 family glycosyl hydrolase
MIFLLLLIFGIPLYAEDKIVIRTKQIFLPEYPDAFNPSLIKIQDEFLLIFRYCPDPINEEWISYVGAVWLNEEFETISEAQLLTTRRAKAKTPSQSEDPRIFSYRGRLFLIFNDNMEIEYPSTWQRREMYMAELFHSQGNFSLSSPITLIYDGKYNTQWWQKNWIPFEWQSNLELIYSITPHEILYPNLINGKCYLAYETEGELNWKWGTPRGSTPALLVDGEYLSFFHSGLYTATEASWGLDCWHYFMGAYTFSSEPPFDITKITPSPIIGEGFYTVSHRLKRVIFPGGFVVSEPYIYLSYGKDDCEMWIATLDKAALGKFLKPL